MDVVAEVGLTCLERLAFSYTKFGSLLLIAPPGPPTMTP
jgi:hypothetical protein